MKRLSLISFALLACLSLSACGNTNKQSKQASEASSLKVANSKLKKKVSKKKQSDKKQRSNSSAVSASGQQNNQQTQTSKANTMSQNNNTVQETQDQRPADVPANFKEYTSYTTDGHKMTQWNDAGHYEGDPDVQYQTIKAQTDAGF